MAKGIKREGCDIEGCKDKHYGLGLCSHHYSSLRRKGLLVSSKECKSENCKGIAFGKGYCVKHYTRIYRYGDPNRLCRSKRKKKFNPIPKDELQFNEGIKMEELIDLGIDFK